MSFSSSLVHELSVSVDDADEDDADGDVDDREEVEVDVEKSLGEEESDEMIDVDDVDDAADVDVDEGDAVDAGDDGGGSLFNQGTPRVVDEAGGSSTASSGSCGIPVCECVMRGHERTDLVKSMSSRVGSASRTARCMASNQ